MKIYLVFSYIKTGENYPELYAAYSKKSDAKNRCKKESKKDKEHKYWYFIRPIKLNSKWYFDIGDI